MNRCLFSWSALFLAFFSSKLAPAQSGGVIPRERGAATRHAPENSLARKTTFTLEDKKHFLNRTHFGIDPEDLAELNAMGMEAYLEAHLSFELPGSTAIDQQAFLEHLVQPGDPPGYEGTNAPCLEIQRYYSKILKDGENPLREEIAFFWHDHFGVDCYVMGLPSRYFMTNHINLLREMGAGNYKDLLHAVALDPAMMVFLNTSDQAPDMPNENFARETMELFTLGEGNGYVHFDIREAARACTGWHLETEPASGLDIAVFDGAQLNPGQKVILGEIIPDQMVPDDQKVTEIPLFVNAIFNQRNQEAAHYLARKVARWFIMENPSDILVDNLAQVFLNSNYDLRRVWKTVFLSEAFYSEQARQGIAKNPVQYMAGFIRATGINLPEHRLHNYLVQMQMAPAKPPTVDGWPSGASWISPMGVTTQANFVNECFENVSDYLLNEIGLDLTELEDQYLLPGDHGQRTALGVIAHLADRMHLELNAEEIAALEHYMNTQDDGSGGEVTVPYVWNGPLVNGLTPTELKVFGLVYVLSQHPGYYSH